MTKWNSAKKNACDTSCCCLFGFNVTFNNFSVISRRCLVTTGSSMLTFIVLPHWSIMPQTLDMIPHPVTLSWHWVDHSQLYPISLSAKQGAASTIFNDFGMSRPEIEPVTSRSRSEHSTCDASKFRLVHKAMLLFHFISVLIIYLFYVKWTLQFLKDSFIF